MDRAQPRSLDEPDPAPGRARRLDYHPELDGIRAVAVLAVLTFHFLAPPGGLAYGGGFLGVDVFFVLSGYLITTLLLRESTARGRIHVIPFYIRRALRLIPALLITLAFGWFVTSLLAKPLTGRPYWQSALATLLYIGNWVEIQETLGVLSHTWSLAIEEQYYLVWPITLIVGLKFVRSKRALAVLLLGAAAAVAALRFVVAAKGNQAVAVLSTVTRADAVVIGSALALALADPPRWLRAVLERREVAPIAAAALFATSLVTRWNSPHVFRGGLFVFNLVTAMLIGTLVLRPRSLATRTLSVQPFPVIGRISYGLYLYHLPVAFLVIGWPFQNTGADAVAACFALTFLIAGASYWLIERRALRLKGRFGSMSELPRAEGEAATSA